MALRASIYGNGLEPISIPSGTTLQTSNRIVAFMLTRIIHFAAKIQVRYQIVGNSLATHRVGNQ
jgi:hypothetical protein